MAKNYIENVAIVGVSKLKTRKDEIKLFSLQD